MTSDQEHGEQVRARIERARRDLGRDPAPGTFAYDLARLLGRAEAAEAKVARVEALVLHLAEQYGRLLAAHEQVVMDTPEDRVLHARVIATFRDFLPGLADALDAGQSARPQRDRIDSTSLGS